MKHPFSPLVLFLALLHAGHAHSKCRNVPGSAEFPTAAAWRVLNTTISGRLVLAVPSAKYCASLPGGACTDAQWTSALFRATIPGAMDQVNFEQDYDVAPPSLCFRNSTTCGQGNVPIYAVKADTVEDVQAAVKFASANNLRVVVKSSGHDYLGRSTAPNSLLIHMANLTDVVFTDAFVVGGENLGSAVTVGPGVPLRDIYQQTKAQGKIAVGGSAATVCAAGGYLQGAGHSAISPLLGLAADNALEFEIVVASGALLKVNSVSNPDLFFALRGGGAGSWGVIVSATLRTHPTFNVTSSIIELAASSNAAAAALAGVHTKHIFDLDAVRGGQYYYLESAGNNTSVLGLSTFTNTSLEQGTAILTPFLDDALAVPGVSLISKTFQQTLINDALFQTDDVVGANLVMGSRLVPTAAYQALDAPATVEKVYRELLDSGPQGILGHLVAGGQVSDNVNISSAVNPAWRTAKTHVILPYAWDDSASLAEINTLRHEFQTSHLAILEQLSGPNAGSYSNEADMFEPNWKTTFYGPNYAKLSAIKQKYDPHDLFIVTSGVGSERWDALGICTVDE
ncbi:FAD-binding domain-containing protein [Mycena albidolilacea]|uniref:FAD-binding domain-containing protein n=1 Tax=Mycena albidolilacea TaxID=1033008 RepID=A0AAD7A3S8_9AGAR|nr:FAD-binding domain-containing protein [Mycena albidolilacea]